MPDLTRPGLVAFGQLSLAQLTLDVWAESPSRSCMASQAASVQGATDHYLDLVVGTHPPPRPRLAQAPASGLYDTDRTTQVAKIRA